MSNVQFNEEQEFTSRSILGAEIVPGMVNFLMRTGIVENKHTAKYTLLGIVATCIILTIGITVYSLNANDSSPELDQRIQNSMLNSSNT